MTAVITIASIAVAIINAAVKADIFPPVTGIKFIGVSIPSPVRRGPEQSHLGRLDPGSRDPEVAVITISPISRRPEVAIVGTGGLFVLGKRRRSDID
jgi:hypothetical protein